MFYHFDDEGKKNCLYKCDLWTLFTEEDLVQKKAQYCFEKIKGNFTE